VFLPSLFPPGKPSELPFPPPSTLARLHVCPFSRETLPERHGTRSRFFSFLARFFPLSRSATSQTLPSLLSTQEPHGYSILFFSLRESIPIVLYRIHSLHVTSAAVPPSPSFPNLLTVSISPASLLFSTFVRRIPAGSSLSPLPFL